MIDIESLLSHRTFIIIHPFSSDEVSSPKFGGTRLIFEQAEFLKQKGKAVTLIALEDIGSITSRLLKSQSSIRQKKSIISSIPRSSENRRWSLNLIGLLTGDIILRFDWIFKAKLRERIKAINSSHPLIICHYPLYYRSIAQSLAAFNSTRMVYEHNVEWHFFESNAGNGPLSRLLISHLKRLELNSLNKADYVACVSKPDAILLVAENIDQAKLTIWLPIAIGAKVVSPDAGRIAKIVGDGCKVGFIGSNFGPNIVAVKNIIELAKKLRDSEITFVVIGSVRDAFQNADVPTNVHFTGYVDDMTSYLTACDAFINPKTTSETGIEIKMFDYLKLDKPIIATTAGSHGFEHFANVKISDIDGIERMLRSLVTIEA